MVRVRAGRAGRGITHSTGTRPVRVWERERGPSSRWTPLEARSRRMKWADVPRSKNCPYRVIIGQCASLGLRDVSAYLCLFQAGPTCLLFLFLACLGFYILSVSTHFGLSVFFLFFIFLFLCLFFNFLIFLNLHVFFSYFSTCTFSFSYSFFNFFILFIFLIFKWHPLLY